MTQIEIFNEIRQRNDRLQKLLKEYNELKKKNELFQKQEAKPL